MIIAGLTGGIATGKSTVCTFFRELGAHIIDADLCAKKVVVRKKPAWHKIVAAFGPSILQKDEEINRAALGEIVFNDTTAKKKLEAIVHPIVRQMMLQELEQAQQKLRPPLVILDVPLLFESGWGQMVEKVIVVYLPLKVQQKRLMERDHLTEAQTLARIKSQIPISTKRTWADYVIDNSRSRLDTKRQVNALWGTLTAKMAPSFIDQPT